MLRKLRDTLLLVALSIFMLLGSSTVSRAEETSYVVPRTNEIVGISDAIEANTVAEQNQDFLSISVIDTNNSEMINVSDYAEKIISTYNNHKEALFSKNATLTDNYSNLLIISYCQVALPYVNGVTPYEWFVAQRKPFLEHYNALPNASDEEILEGYSSLLLYLCDTMTEEAVSGYEIDQELYDFVENEINERNIEW